MFEMEHITVDAVFVSSMNEVHVFCDLLNDTAASEETAQPDSEDISQQPSQQVPSETTNVHSIPENNSGTSRLQPEVPHQQPVAESQTLPPVCIFYSIVFLVVI